MHYSSRRVPLEKQELFVLPERLNPPRFKGFMLHSLIVLLSVKFDHYVLLRLPAFDKPSGIVKISLVV